MDVGLVFLLTFCFHFQCPVLTIFENRGIDIGGKCAYLIGSLVSVGQLFNILFV